MKLLTHADFCFLLKTQENEKTQVKESAIALMKRNLDCLLQNKTPITNRDFK